MKYITGVTDFEIKDKTAISLGKFDGIHMGHECLISDILNHKDLKSVIFTFDINPTMQLSNKKYNLLTTNAERRDLLEKRGIDYLYECPFTEEIRNMEAEDFVRKVVSELNVKYIAVGTDFRFGHNRRGDYKLLTDMSKELGYEITVHDKVKYNDRDISSTYVREEILNGNIALANKLLGYPYTIEGVVEHGKALGRTLGFPTTNIVPADNKILPPYGVYVSRVKIEGKYYRGVTNIGVKPTVGKENEIGAETFIINFNKDIYGETILLELLGFIRGEMRFDSIEDLKVQMEKDIRKAIEF